MHESMRVTGPDYIPPKFLRITCSNDEKRAPKKVVIEGVNNPKFSGLESLCVLSAIQKGTLTMETDQIKC